MSEPSIFPTAPVAPTAPPVSSPTPAESAVQPTDASEVDEDALRERVIDVLRTCYDPEIPVNIHELGLIYEVGVDGDKNVTIKMTLTSPACPVAGSLPPEVETKASAVPGVKSAKVILVWEPTWEQSMMSEAARLQLGLM